MFVVSYLQTEEFFYLNVFLKLLLGLVAIVFIINRSGKGNLAPTSAIDQVQNYVLGGIIGGVIYSPSVSILQFAVVLAIWALLIIGLRRLKTKNHAIKQFVLRGEENPKYPIITDGIVQTSVLDDVDKTEEWLTDELQRAGYNSAAEIFLADYENGELKLIPFVRASQAE